jgi:predicted DNA-binding transcriptional regulator YafY
MADSKKLGILYVLNVLEEYSDEDHYLTQQQIINHIHNDYGLDIARKSVADDLIQLGSVLDEDRNEKYDIDKGPKGGYALLSRTYDSSEIAYLIDAVFSSKLISGGNARILATKLSNELSTYQRTTFTYICKSNDVNRSTLPSIFSNIDIITRAIDQKRKVSFQLVNYNSPTTTKNMRHGQSYVVSPYYVVNMRGKYYLIGYQDGVDRKAMFTLELINGIKILDEEPLVDIHNIKAYEYFDIAKFLNDHVYAFINKEVVNAKVILSDEKSIHFAVDWFGKNVTDIIPNNDGTFNATIRNDVASLAYWCLQYPFNIKVLSPQSLLDYIQEELDKLNENYPAKK